MLNEENSDYLNLKANEKNLSYITLIWNATKKIEGIALDWREYEMNPWVNQKKVKFVAASDIDKY